MKGGCRKAYLFFWDGESYGKNMLYQFDYGQRMRVMGVDFPDGAADPEVHYSINRDPAIVRIGTITEEGHLDAPVPDAILRKNGAVTVYIYVADEDSGQTVYSLSFSIIARPDTGKDPGDSEDRPLSVLIRKLADGKADGIALDGQELQLTAGGNPVGDPVTLPAGGAADMKPMTTEEIDHVMEGE